MINPFVLFNLMDSLAQYMGAESVFCFEFVMLAFIFGFLYQHCIAKYVVKNTKKHYRYDYAEFAFDVAISQMNDNFQNINTTNYPHLLPQEICNKIAQGDCQTMNKMDDALNINANVNVKENEKHQHSEKPPRFHFSDAKEQDLQHLLNHLFDNSHESSESKGESEKENNIEK
jgi:hypothetical protein